MKDLSQHVLDMAQNSISAGARTLRLDITERNGRLSVLLADDGAGIPPHLLARVTDPFTTTRTTRKVGLGLPLVRLAAELTGGSLSVQSQEGRGTTVTAIFDTRHIDCPPQGDMAEAVSLIIQGAPQMEVRYTYDTAAGKACFDTREIRAALGPDISLAEPEIVLWIKGYIKELTGGL